jgi:hypothetical protein
MASSAMYGESGRSMHCIFYDQSGTIITNFEPSSSKVIGVILPSALIGDTLRIEAPNGFSIWQTDKLVLAAEGQRQAIYVIDSLLLNEKARVTFSLFHPEGFKSLPLIYLNGKLYTCEDYKVLQTNQNVLPKYQEYNTEPLPYAVALFVVCIIVLALLKNLEADNYLNFFSFSESNDGKHHPDKFDLSKSSIRFIILIVLLNIGGVSCLWLLNIQLVQEPIILFRLGIFNNTHPYVLPVLLALIIYIVYLVFTIISNYIFGLLKYTTYIISQELRVITFYLIAAMSIGVVLRLNQINIIPMGSLFTALSVIAFAYLTIIVWLRITQSSNISRAYLFCYICTAKLLPLIIIYKTFITLFTKQSTLI